MAAQQDITLHADDYDDDADSSPGYEPTLSTASIASSILKDRRENGRTYNAYKDGRRLHRKRR